ncbi:MAG TPA: hypothetical protein VEB86_04335, partial [Chryseosolibacter sp.]|nr:hypothetical protein [Chryseosolibacter sp.]
MSLIHITTALITTILLRADSSTVTLISAEKSYEVTLAEMRNVARYTDRRLSSSLRFGVKTYNLVYKTTYKGKEIEASGVVHVP